MGCATSMCGCTQTAVATVTPRALSHAHVRSNPQGPNIRKSAGSHKSHLVPSLGSVDKNSSLWSTYDLEIRDIDEFSEGDRICGPCEIESDDDDQRFLDQYNNNKSLISHNSHPSHHGSHHGSYHGSSHHGSHHSTHHGHHIHPGRGGSGGGNSNPGNLLGENSKWTVTVRLYAQKAGEQPSSDIPSVEETGSHYSSGEWPGKSGSSQGSRGSGKRVHPTPVSNGIVNTKEYRQKTPTEKYSNKSLRPNRLHHSNSERPHTKQELAQHERTIQQAAMNTTYAWGRGQGGPPEYVPETESKPMANGRGPLNGLPMFNGLATLPGSNPQKYEQSSLSQYLSLGTNHYRSNRSSLRSRQRPESEETWQSLCDSGIPPGTARPQSSHHTHRSMHHRGFNNLLSEDRARSPSPIDSLMTDYLVDTEIMEDFSGSTHSLANLGSKPNSGSSSGRGASIETASPPVHVVEKEVTIIDSRQESKKSSRPRAALRRHRSEPFHFLV